MNKFMMTLAALAVSTAAVAAEPEYATVRMEIDIAKLEPGAMLRVSVPDLHTLCRLFLDPELSTLQRFQVMQMMFGGQTNDADTHYVGLDENFLSGYLSDAGFTGITRVDAFNLFDDTSAMHYKLPISLNMTARKPAAA